MKISSQDFEKYDFYEDDYGAIYAEHKDSGQKVLVKEGDST